MIGVGRGIYERLTTMIPRDKAFGMELHEICSFITCDWDATISTSL
jgi:hypothetical protein